MVCVVFKNGVQKLNAHQSKALLIGSTYKIGGLDLDEQFVLNGEMLQYTQLYNYLGLSDTNMTIMPLLAKLKTRIVN